MKYAMLTNITMLNYYVLIIENSLCEILMQRVKLSNLRPIDNSYFFNGFLLSRISMTINNKRELVINTKYLY